MGFVSDFVEGIFGGSDDAEDAAKDAANTQAASQTEALNYLKEVEKIPQQFRGEALTKLGGLYGLDGGTGSQKQLINQAMKSPLYSAIMSGKNEGEASILRNASATGGLRSGNVQGAMYDFNVDLKTKALLESYNQQLSGLQGLAQLPSNANQIASGISGIGTTRAQGITAAAQAEATGEQNAMNTVFGGLNALMTGGVI
jgi:hypothetical protein